MLVCGMGASAGGASGVREADWRAGCEFGCVWGGYVIYTNIHICNIYMYCV